MIKLPSNKTVVNNCKELFNKVLSNSQLNNKIKFQPLTENEDRKRKAWFTSTEQTQNQTEGRSRRKRKHSVNMREVSETRVKYEASNETKISKYFDILLHFMLQNWPCFALHS